MKVIKSKMKTSKNPMKKHDNKFILTFHYDKCDVTPCGIGLETHGTIVDAILGMVRLMEYINTEAAENGKSITDFIGQAVRAYANQMDYGED